MKKLFVATSAGGLLLSGWVLGATPSSASIAGRWTNCDHVHAYWPHGVGRVSAVDHTSGTPVTNFKRSNRLYRKAMNHNSRLDADGDKIACEQA